MVSNLPSALDNLASNGIINFDADAYVKGETPRYVGNPGQACLPFEQPLPAFPQQGRVPQIPEQPKKDEFVHKKEEKGNPSWKKALAFVLVAGAAAFLGFRHREKLGKFAKNMWAKIKSIGTKKPTPVKVAPAPTPVATAATKPKSKIPKWVKITGGSLLGLLGLVGLSKFISKKTAQNQQPHP